jgi:hypothetical protein
MPQMMEGPTSVSFPWFSLRERRSQIRVREFIVIAAV